jgi:hypothetical protein
MQKCINDSMLDGPVGHPIIESQRVVGISRWVIPCRINKSSEELFGYLEKYSSQDDSGVRKYKKKIAKDADTRFGTADYAIMFRSAACYYYRIEGLSGTKHWCYIILDDPKWP